MPEMDGLEATRQIRQLDNEDKANTPIIAMTAHVLAEQKQKCIEAGMNDYIAKPFKTQDLISKINALVGAGEVLETFGHGSSAVGSLVDFSHLNELSGGDGSFIKEMVQVFLEEAPLDLAKLRKHYDSNELNNTRKIAHKMKSSLGLLGIRRGFDLAETIHRSTDTSATDELSTLVDRFELVCNDAIAELQA